MSRPLGIGQGLAIVRDAASIGARTGADRFDATPGSVDVTAAWVENSDLDGWDMAAKRRRSAPARLSGLCLIASLALAAPAGALALREPASKSTTNSAPTFGGETNDM